MTTAPYAQCRPLTPRKPIPTSGSGVGEGLYPRAPHFAGYDVSELLGRGGMGEVWSATKMCAGGLVLPCAIKVMRSEYATLEQDRRRFFHEALLTAHLAHKNIVKIHDFGQTDAGSLYLVMERVDGIDLRGLTTALDSSGATPLAIDLILYIVAEVLAALSYAHGHRVNGYEFGIIHHDVTSGNVMIASSGEVKLMDFGIAQFANEGAATNNGFAVGTPRYMAPERLVGQSRSESDLYSVGVLLHELLAGRPYRSGCSATELKRCAMIEPPPPIGRELPSWLDRLVHQLLRPTPKHRPTADEALELIEEHQSSHGRARRELSQLYQLHIGQPRTGMTDFVELGREICESPAMAQEPERQGSLALRSVPPQRGGPLRRGLRRLLKRPAPASLRCPDGNHKTSAVAVSLGPGPTVTDDDLTQRTCRRRAQRAGESYDPDWHVPRQQEEAYTLDCLGRPGSPVAVAAPLHFGKSWFVRRIVQQLRERQPQTTVIHLDLDTVDLSSLDSLLASMLRQIVAAVGVETGELSELWPRYGTPQHRFMTALESHLRSRTAGPVVLALDLPDRMWEFPRRDDFFGIMRALSGQADPERWSWLRVLLAFSMSTALYIEDTARSPWNVPEVQLDELDRAQVEHLAGRYGLAWSQAELDELSAAVGGHPYLVRAAMHGAKRGDRSVACGLGSEGVRAHLGQVEALLARDEHLCASLVAAVAGERVSIGHRRRLEAAGLLRWKPATRDYVLRFPIYAEIVARLS